MYLQRFLHNEFHTTEFKEQTFSFNFMHVLFGILQEHGVTLPCTWVMACAYAPSGCAVACG